MRFFCRTCPYVFQLKSKVTSEATLERKVVDDVLGGPAAWKNADQTEGARALAATTACHRSACLSFPHPACHRHRARLRLPQPASAPLSAANCGKCGNDRAYCQQLQIRSADEPMTTFYKCTACGMRWRED